MIAWRPTSLKAIPCAESWAVVAIGMAAWTASGYAVTHSRACIPPIEPPATARSFSIPRWSTSAFCALTMSPMVMTGNSIA